MGVRRRQLHAIFARRGTIRWRPRRGGHRRADPVALARALEVALRVLRVGDRGFAAKPCLGRWHVFGRITGEKRRRRACRRRCEEPFVRTKPGEDRADGDRVSWSVRGRSMLVRREPCASGILLLS
jgi:hypothetical protein